MVYAGQSGRLRTIASAWTDIDPVDEFRQIAADRAAFRATDLLALCDALDRLAERLGGRPTHGWLANVVLQRGGIPTGFSDLQVDV